MNEIFDFLGKIPQGCWNVVAAAVAALIAYLGVKHQLHAHERRERISREKDMRREVFLAAAEATASALEYVRYFADPVITDEDLREKIKDYSKHTSKVHVVGDLATIQSLVAFDLKLLEAVGQLTFQRKVMMQLKKRAEAQRKALLDHQAECETKIKSGASLTTEEIARLRKALSDLTLDDQSTAMALTEQSFNIAREANGLLIGLTELQNECLICARRDLGFDLDENAYRRCMNNAVGSTNDMLAKLMASVEQTWQRSTARNRAVEKST